MTREPKVRHIKIPVAGDIHHNSAIQLAIGGLVIAWANAESIFKGMLQELVCDTGDAPHIVWHSHRTTSGRIALLDHLVRDRIKTPALVTDVQGAIKQFQGFSGARNFYCHCIYAFDEQERIVGVEGMTLSQEGSPLRVVSKRFDGAAFNEIQQSTVGLKTLNPVLWALLQRIQTHLGTRHVKLPSGLNKTPP